jgi:hypothetical protein
VNAAPSFTVPTADPLTIPVYEQKTTTVETGTEAIPLGLGGA